MLKTRLVYHANSDANNFITTKTSFHLRLWRLWMKLVLLLYHPLFSFFSSGAKINFHYFSSFFRRDLSWLTMFRRLKRHFFSLCCCLLILMFLNLISFMMAWGDNQIFDDALDPRRRSLMFTMDFMFTQVIIDHYCFRATSFYHLFCFRPKVCSGKRSKNYLSFNWILRHFLIIHP